MVEAQNDTLSQATCAEHPQCGPRPAQGETCSSRLGKVGREGYTEAGARTRQARPSWRKKAREGIGRPLATCGQAQRMRDQSERAAGMLVPGRLRQGPVRETQHSTDALRPGSRGQILGFSSKDLGHLTFLSREGQAATGLVGRSREPGHQPEDNPRKDLHMG